MMSRTTILLIAILSACLTCSAGTITDITGSHAGSTGVVSRQSEAVLVPYGPAYLSAYEPQSAATLVLVQTPASEPAVEDPAKAAAADQEAAKNAAEKPAETAPNDAATTPGNAEKATPAPPQPELSPAMVALRDRVRRTLASFARLNLNTQENTATELMQYCLAFGCQSEVHLGNSAAKMVNGITCLCWNYPCAGFEPLTISQGHIAARLGYGLQEHPAQLLALLALSRVPPTYPIRVGDDVRTVADLVQHERLSCRAGQDQSLRLIGLSYYADEPTWKNDLGEDWSLERMVKQELDQPILGATAGGTYRLMGLSYALDRRAKQKQPIDGQFRRAEEFVGKFEEYALALQNSDGSWGPQMLASKGVGRDAETQLYGTGHVTEWLVMSVDEKVLADFRIVRSVEYLNNLLGNRRYGSLGSLSTREVGSIMHALHALAVYDQRMFAPRAPETRGQGG